ncbi:hypothetical protein ABEF91_000753 [Exophiala dermatitidis]
MAPFGSRSGGGGTSSSHVFGIPRKFRLNSQRTETEALLASQHDQDEEDHADSDGLYPPHCTWTSNQDEMPRAADLYRNAECNVYENILRIRRDIINSIDDPYSLEQLKAPRMNISVVRPLVDSLFEKQDLSLVYCLLVNRMQFIREQSSATHHQTVNLTRALLCELVAEKLLRRYNEHNPGPRGLLKLANILVAGFEPLQGAPPEIVEQSTSRPSRWTTHRKAATPEKKLTALEVAIVSASKSFLASSACQKVVEAIYRGKLVYTPSSFIEVIPDRWKKRPISLYDPRRAPLLNQYRLVVPRTRNIIEVFQFVVLLGLYIAVMVARESRMTSQYTVVEAVFDIYASGWVLDQVASVLEHGWGVYTQNLWSFLDATFSIIFATYLILRLHAFRISDQTEAVVWARTSLDVLSCAAPVLIPRLAFNFMSENMLFLSLRAMMSDFLTLSALAVWCFAGFMLSLKWLHAGAHSSVTIGKWMIWIWFGLDGTGIDESVDFHWLLGPVLMILFAFLGNTLFLTILVSMLTNTFSGIVANAVQEILFRRAVLTFEGVKSDAIFAYMPPFNILALMVMLPLKLLVSERMFHKINVAAVRILNLPTLLVIAWYERRTLWMSDKHRPHRAQKIDWKNPNGPRATASPYWAITRFTAHGEIYAVFDIDPPQAVLDKIAEEDELEYDSGIGKALNNNLNERFEFVPTARRASQSVDPKRRESVDQRGDRKEMQRTKSVNQEFGDSSEAEDQPTHPRGYRKLKRGERMDSLIDLNDDGNDKLMEANARLHKMEAAIARIEAMLVQVMNEDASSGSSKEQAESEQEAQTSTTK